MNEEQNPKDQNNEIKVDPGATAGQRLDQFISGAKRLGAATGQKAKEAANAAAPKLKRMESGAKLFGVATGRKAKEMVDAAAPRLKEMGGAASETASKAFGKSRLASSSFMVRVRDYCNAGGKTRKGLLILGGSIGGFLILSLLTISFFSKRAGHDDSGFFNFDDVQSGMTEAQVDKLIGMPSNLDKKSDGSLLKTWNSPYATIGAIHVTFVEGKAVTKSQDQTVPEPSPEIASIPAAPDLLKQVQGTWRQVATEAGGVRTPSSDFGSSRITITGNSLHFAASMGGKDFVKDITFTLDPSHDPAWMDWSWPGQGIAPGIVSLEGGTMRFYQAKASQARPKNFDDAKGDGDNVQIYQR